MVELAASGLAGVLLGLLDVGLVERVDPEDDPGDRGGDLPADELGREVDRVVEVDPDHGVAGGLEGVSSASAEVRPEPQAGPFESASDRRTKTRSGP